MWRLGEEEVVGYNRQVESTIERIRATGRVLETIDPDRLTPSEDREVTPSTIVIVPGAFAKEYPQHGAQGQRLVGAARDWGFNVDVLDTPSFCSPVIGGSYIANWLTRTGRRDVILVSLSKGSSDTASFFSQPSYRPFQQQIRAWVSIGGLLHGSPIVNAIHARPLWRLFISGLLRMKGYRYTDLSMLMWNEAHAPSWNTFGALSIPVIHVQSVPRYEDLSSGLAIRAVKRALPYGVSDGGGVLLSDLARYDGSFVLIEKRDHYFRDIPMQALLGRILYWIDYVVERRHGFLAQIPD
jgi:hypothetical protein